MINTDKYEGHAPAPWYTLVCSTTGKKWVIDRPEDCAWESIALLDGVGEDDVGWKNMALIADAPLLLAEVKRLREENETLRKMDWEYECLWTWLAENTNLLNTIEPLMEEWKKEMIE